jgi:hypothetical protein
VKRGAKGMQIRSRSICLVQCLTCAAAIGSFMPGPLPAEDSAAKQSDKEIIVRVARVLN